MASGADAIADAGAKNAPPYDKLFPYNKSTFPPNVRRATLKKRVAEFNSSAHAALRSIEALNIELPTVLGPSEREPKLAFSYHRVCDICKTVRAPVGVIKSHGLKQCCDCHGLYKTCVYFCKSYMDRRYMKVWENRQGQES